MNNRSDDRKAKDFGKTMKKLFSNLKAYLIPIIIAVILSISASVFQIIGPSKLSDITNTISDGIQSEFQASVPIDMENMPEDISEEDMQSMMENVEVNDESVGIDLEKVKNITIFLAIIYGLSLLFNYTQGFIMATITNKFSKKLRTRISNKINKLPLKYFDNNSYGDVLSRVTNDVDSISQTMNQSVSSLVGAMTLLVGTAIAMFITNSIMAITAIVATLLGFSLLGVILKKSQKYFKEQQVELGNINGHIEEIYSGHTVVKAYNAKEKVTKEFDEINDKLFNSARKSQFLSGLMQPIMQFVGNFGYVCVCVVGSILVINGDISIGTIVSFMIYIRIFTQPLTQLAQSLAQFQSMAAASERVFDFLDEEELIDESNKSKVLTNEEVKGDIEFNHVKFGYNEELIIKDFNLKVKSGQKVAIVGPTGAGKTTLVNLLMKFYELNSGDIKIDGVSTSELTRENIHDLFVMVLQDTWLFNGTVKENIVFNKEDVSDKQVEEACEVVGADHFIKALPHSYDTVLNDVETISAGEKQLLTIARGMIENGPFLILDEATSSVDTRTEELVQIAMDKLTEGKTSFIIAHRLSTIKNADVILVLNEGNIVEQGNHNELMKKDGFYAELYNSQFQS